MAEEINQLEIIWSSAKILQTLLDSQLNHFKIQTEVAQIDFKPIPTQNARQVDTEIDGQFREGILHVLKPFLPHMKSKHLTLTVKQDPGLMDVF